jgi:hypothetical protein
MSSTPALVNWKLFELQAALIAEEVDPRYLNICKEWFTEQHFLDVIEERTGDNKCGYPLCSQPLDGTAAPPSRGGKTLVAPPGEGSEDGLFCSEKCALTARRYQSTLLNTNPMTREVAKHLRPPPKQNTSKCYCSVLYVFIIMLCDMR